jgi:hypothetical protein
MREYEDNIRLYTPVLQRVIILLAVIIAVPVVMWTITTVIHTYVAPPKVPTFQRMTVVEPQPGAPTGTQDAAQGSASPTPQPAPAPPPPAPPVAQVADAGTAPASDARTPLLEIKRPLTAAPAPAAPPDAGAPAGAPQAAAPTAPVQPISVAAQPTAPVPAAAPMTAVNAAPAAPADRGFAWPNSPTAAPANTATDSGASPPPALTTQDAQPSSDADAGDLPDVAPLKGPIPLPRQRPGLFAMAQVIGGPVPLPRARPIDAPSAAPTVTGIPIYDPSVIH